MTSRSASILNPLLLLLLLLLLLFFCLMFDESHAKDFRQVMSEYDTVNLNRSSFPHGFLFGTASSAYQYEGGAHEGGRGPSIWDTYTHQYPDKIADRSNGDVAIDAYHRYKGDVRIMKQMGLDAYRFSISWSRILPKGKLSGGVNKEGIQYYNNLINELLAHNIQPFVTLFHWDLPQSLEDEYGGFLSPLIVDDFRDYAGVCFREFGDRVKHWISLNEPWSYSMGGYGFGMLAPGRCSSWLHLNCTGGDSGTEPYLVTHNQLLAHAAAVRLYKRKYQGSQRGEIGITLICHWMLPYSDAKHNQNAASRALDFMLGWFMNPLTTGDYPHSMRSLVRDRLPKFSRKQSVTLKGSYDFVGLNYYTANYVAYSPGYVTQTNPNSTYYSDAQTNLTNERNGVPIGRKGASDWLFVFPSGIRDLLLYVKRNYNNPSIYITENGIDEFNNGTLPLEQQLNDDSRVDFHYRHLLYLQEAIRCGVKVKGYFAWSLLDNFEWIQGYTVRFGLNYVDYNDGLKRYPKLSARWFGQFLNKHQL